MSEENKDGPGRPTLYKPEFCDEVIKHMSEGNSFWSFGTKVKPRGVSLQTLDNWTKQYPDFLEAKKIGEVFLLQFDEDLNKAGSAGQLERRSKTITKTVVDKKGNTVTTSETIYEAATFAQTYRLFLMKNRYPRLYRDKIEVDTTPANKTKMTDIVKGMAENDPAGFAALKEIAKKLVK